MESERTIPTSLRVVATLFLLGGIASTIEVIVSLTQSHLNFNFGVLGLFIGPGLLKLKRGWRTWALVFLWVAMIGSAIVIVAFAAGTGHVDLTLFGQEVGKVSRAIGAAFGVAILALAIWQYRVLTRADVRALFEAGPS